MVLNIQETPKYHEAMNELAEKISKGASQEEQKDLFANAFKVLGDEINSMAEEELERLVTDRLKNQTLTPEEIKFFNEVTKPEDNPGVKTEKIIPEEILIRVFENLKTEHPLLSVVKFKNTGLRLKAVIAETEGTAVWGEIYDEIKGQLKQTFDEIDFGMNKLTAFVVLPKDALRFSYSWLKQFIIDQIQEAFAVALELAIVKGDGNKQPVGLIKKVDDASRVLSGKIITYPTDKDALASLAQITPENAVATFAPVMKHLSEETKKSGKKVYHNIDGKVCLLVNPADRWELEAKFTKLTDGGAHVLTLPYSIKVIESLAIETGKAIAFVTDRYDAFMAASATIEEYDQTFALEDNQLYTCRGYFYGKAKDNNAAALLTLAGG
ncbi:TPA: phage major capsid protein [Streptococcus suis]